ncbi:inosine triphosphate pyrophosphatase [Mycotypha africana]|uniref:inosine triphosphate pyrophosphatase n=1 Tax=Mycotypha africana TaxID=64632 RepID=UPI0023007AA7|nr:inosine triphosphate pyrophosphatase [Mycotypha africana]KAI8982420.1 inosine triphosphate pyrophosphatase [Mycotypha africana]
MSSQELPKLVFVTGNKNKLLEVQAILKGVIDVESHKIDLPELQGTTEDIARQKCKLAAETLNGPCITEDTALCFNAMNGLPGPYIKWFQDSIGHAGINKMLDGFDDRSAYALCTFGYCEGPGHEPMIFEGRTNGKIVPSRGPCTFGWDAIFQPDGFDKTYAELDKEVKNSISHRGKALELLKKFFADRQQQQAS